jgi:hypothetical protein
MELNHQFEVTGRRYYFQELSVIYNGNGDLIFCVEISEIRCIMLHRYIFTVR